MSLQEVSKRPIARNIKVFQNLVNVDFTNFLELVKFDEKSFENAFLLRNIIFPPNLRIIDSGVFYGCAHLTSIKIPASVEIIGENAFNNCTKLEQVTFEGPIILAESAFQNCPRLVRRIYLQTRYVDCVYGKYSELKDSIRFEKIECGISLEEFEDDSNIVILRCGHAFLEEALQEWAKRQRICPACKQKISVDF